MPHSTTLLATIAVGLVGAFGLGVLAKAVRLPPIVGYLVAGILIGPYTPGFIADQESASQLAEIGIILLMFSVGLHFNYRDLLRVARIAIPGAISQMTVATALGAALGLGLGWSFSASILFGVCLSCASTVVLLRMLEERQLLDTRTGHAAVGWLIVEDLAIVVALVVVPILASGGDNGQASGQAWAIAGSIGWTAIKIAAFIALLFVVGGRLIPWTLARVAGTGSRELFTLGVLSIGLGVAVGAAQLFDVSFALGAFLAGMVLKESELSQRAADDSLPFRDAFAVLFFVSVGMIVDPAVVVEHPLAVAATLVIIVIGKSAIAFAIVRMLGYSSRMGHIIAAALAQIGEFSFILVTLGLSLGILPDLAGDLVLAGAILSIILNPFIFGFAMRRRASRSGVITETRPTRKAPASSPPNASGVGVDTPFVYRGTGHAIVVGYGRVGRRVASSLWQAGLPAVVIDSDPLRVEDIRAGGHDAILGNATLKAVLRQAGINAAGIVLVAVPNGFEAGEIVARARKIRPDTPVVARTHQEEEIPYLAERGATRVIMGELEIAGLMVQEAKGAIGRPRRFSVRRGGLGREPRT